MTQVRVDKIWREADPSHLDLILAARSMVVARRALYQVLPVAMIQCAVLDMLTGIFIAEHDGEKQTIAMACAMTTLAYPSARRWFNVLRADGFLQTEGDEADAVVTLSEIGHENVSDAIRAVIAAQRKLHSGA